MTTVHTTCPRCGIRLVAEITAGMNVDRSLRLVRCPPCAKSEFGEMPRGIEVRRDELHSWFFRPDHSQRTKG